MVMVCNHYNQFFLSHHQIGMGECRWDEEMSKDNFLAPNPAPGCGNKRWLRNQGGCKAPKRPTLRTPMSLYCKLGW